MKEAEELRAGVKTAANVAITLFGPGAIKQGVEIAGNITGTLEKVGKACEIVNKFQSPSAPAKPEAKPDVKPGPTEQTDWRALLDTTIRSYDTYIKGNKQLAALNRLCLQNVKFLNSVAEGKAANGARSSEQGLKVESFRAGADDSIAQLGTIKKGIVSAGAADFAGNVSKSLDAQSNEKIEQDVALKWLSGLSKEQLSAIDDADSYLKSIGVIDARAIDSA